MALFIECQKKLNDLQKNLTQSSKNAILRTHNWRRLSTVASTNCDVVLLFKKDVTQSQIDWFIEVLGNRVPELVISKIFHSTSGQVALYLTASYRNLLRGAEELRIEKPLLPEYGGDLCEFSVEDLNCFNDVLNEKLFLSSSERSTIVNHFLMCLHAHQEDSEACSIKLTEGQLMIPLLQSKGFIDQIFPLHDPETLRELSRNWVRGWTFRQPLDEIQEYFGIKIALYFAWLGNYTYSLILPALAGLLVWIFVDSDRYISFGYLFMTIFTLLWTFLFLEHWQRTSAYLTYQWGARDTPIPLLEEPRPSFKGFLTLCPITGRTIRTYPLWRRNLILCFITGPIVFLSLLIVVFITFGYVQLQEKVDLYVKNENSFISNSILLNLPKILLAVAISVLEVGYRIVAKWLTNLENHRLENDHYNHYVGKLILLQFVNSFYSLFYTAFYLKDLDLLKKQLVALLFTRQILGNMKEIFLPYSQSRLYQVLLSFRQEKNFKNKLIESCSTTPIVDRKNSEFRFDGEEILEQVLYRRIQDVEQNTTDSKKSSSDGSKKSSIPSAEWEATQPRYEDPTDDYLEMFIQFGYVTMFSCIFPLAGLLAFINNLIEIRGDAFKLISFYQRPFAQRVNSIGVWQLALEGVSYVTVMANIGLIVISGTANHYFPNLSTTHLIILLVFIEHLIFILRAAISSLISHTPRLVTEKIAKLEHRRREALKTLERETMRENQRQQTPPIVQNSQ